MDFKIATNKSQIFVANTVPCTTIQMLTEIVSEIGRKVKFSRIHTTTSLLSVNLAKEIRYRILWRNGGEEFDKGAKDVKDRKMLIKITLLNKPP